VLRLAEDAIAVTGSVGAVVVVVAVAAAAACAVAVAVAVVEAVRMRRRRGGWTFCWDAYYEYRAGLITAICCTSITDYC
jgi:hypothetical protein